MMLAIPAPTAVTTPLFDTVATAGLFDDHAIVRPVSATLLASNVVARACVVPPMIIDEESSATFTVATGTAVAPLTVSAACAVRPSIEPTMFAVPAPTADTKPVEVTVATAGLLDVQAGARPVITAPPSSYKVALACVVCPNCTADAASETATVATICFGGVESMMVHCALPRTPSMVAMTSTLPDLATDCTSFVEYIFAMFVFAVVQ